MQRHCMPKGDTRTHVKAHVGLQMFRNTYTAENHLKFKVTYESKNKMKKKNETGLSETYEIIETLRSISQSNENHTLI